MSINIRWLQFKVNKGRNLISSIINRLRFSMYGISYGHNLKIHGKLYLKLFPDVKVTIGDNFYCSSGRYVNALCSNKRGIFYLVHDAELIIGNNVGMSSPVIWCNKRIVIGDNVKIGANTIILDMDCHAHSFMDRRNDITDWAEPQEIKIGNDVLIGMNTTILKGVTIGDRAIVGASSVVTKDIPADSVAVGNPARIIKTIDK